MNFARKWLNKRCCLSYYFEIFAVIYIFIYTNNIFTFFLSEFPYFKSVCIFVVHEINASLNLVGFSLRKVNQISESTQQAFAFSKTTVETKIRCKVCPKLIIKTSGRRQWLSSAFTLNFEHVSHLFQMFLLLTLNR